MTSEQLWAAMRALPDADLIAAIAIDDTPGAGAYYRADTVVRLLTAERERMCGQIRSAMGHAEAGYDDVAWRLLDSLVGPNVPMSGPQRPAQEVEDGTE